MPHRFIAPPKHSSKKCCLTLAPPLQGYRYLAVKPQEVIPGQTESANRRFACEANMRPVPVVAMEPSGQRGVSLLWVLECGGVGPFSECGLNEALGLAVRLRGVGLDPDVLDSELLAGAGEGFGEIAAAIVSHDAFDGNAKALEVGNGGGDTLRPPDALTVAAQERCTPHGKSAPTGYAGSIQRAIIFDWVKHEAPGVHHAPLRCAGCVAGRRARAAGEAAL